MRTEKNQMKIKALQRAVQQLQKEQIKFKSEEHRENRYNVVWLSRLEHLNQHKKNAMNARKVSDDKYDAIIRSFQANKEYKARTGVLFADAEPVKVFSEDKTLEDIKNGKGLKPLKNASDKLQEEPGILMDLNPAEIPTEKRGGISWLIVAVISLGLGIILGFVLLCIFGKLGGCI